MGTDFNSEFALGYFEPDKPSNSEFYGLLMLLLAATLFGGTPMLDTENLSEDIRVLFHKYTEEQKEDDK